MSAALRVRMVASLRNVDDDLAARVAEGLGLDLPDPLPRVLESPASPEVTASPALSLTAVPGETGMRTRKVAILVADGVDGKSLTKLHTSLTNAGVVPRFVGSRLGTFATADGETIEADASMENTPSVLFDGLVLPDGEAGVKTLMSNGQTLEFIVNQFRHNKTILAFGASRALLKRAGVPGSGDTGLLMMEAGDKNAASAFMGALAKHRHYERELDPPRV